MCRRHKVWRFLLSTPKAPEKIDTPIGQTLLRVRAADADSTYGILTYSLEQNDEGIFRVDPQNGEIFLARPIDYETKNKYEVYFLVKFSNAVKSILFSDGRDGF